MRNKDVLVYNFRDTHQAVCPSCTIKYVPFKIDFTTYRSVDGRGGRAKPKMELSIEQQCNKQDAFDTTRR